MALTTSSILSRVESLFAQTPELQTMRRLASDKVAISLARDWQDPAVTGNSLALLQYTSGSTTTPRGVMVSHREKAPEAGGHEKPERGAARGLGHLAKGDAARGVPYDRCCHAVGDEVLY
jgi:hypothetical protein